MATKDNFRKRVMKYAWQLFKATGDAWRICMLKAWRIWRLSKGMKESVRTFWYLKTDGTVRRAVGTLKGIGDKTAVKRLTKPSWKTMTYFDIEKNAFRCFRIENFICAL